MHKLFLDINNITNNRERFTEYYEPGEPESVGHIRQSAAFANLMYRVYL